MIEIMDYKIEEDGKEAWKIEDLGGANWALMQIKKAKAAIDERADLMKSYAEWQIREDRKNKDTIEFMESKLMEYLADKRIDDPKYKINVPAGKVSTRKSTSWEYDDDVVLDYLQQNKLEDFIRVKTEINKSDFKKSLKVVGDKVVDENGEVIPGITISQNENISISFEV